MCFGPHPTPSSFSSTVLCRENPALSSTQVHKLTFLPALPCASSAKRWTLCVCKGLITLRNKGHPSSRVLSPGPWTFLRPGNGCSNRAAQHHRGPSGPGVQDGGLLQHAAPPPLPSLLPALSVPSSLSHRPSGALCPAYMHIRPKCLDTRILTAQRASLRLRVCVCVCV